MKISASILACDFANAENELKRIEKHVDFLHMDIMDGHFVNNISFGPYIAECLSRITDLKLDIHLMIDRPLKYIDEFIKINPDIITVHYETINETDFKEIKKKLNEKNIKLGVAIKPDTPYEAIISYLDEIDLILIMSVEPGFCGQEFNDIAIYKIDRIRETNENVLIEVDGGINDKTIKLVNKANIAVLGSYIFNSQTSSEDIKKLKI